MASDYACDDSSSGVEIDDLEDNPTPEQRQYGSWKILPEHLKMLPVHAAVLRTGDVLFFGPDMTRDERHHVDNIYAYPEINNMEAVNIALFTPFGAVLRYPPMQNRRNLFCAGQCFLPDGRLLVAAGHAFAGIGWGADHDTHVYDPESYLWSRRLDMDIARWYLTCLAMEDGRVLIVSGYSNGVPPNPSAGYGKEGPPLNQTYDVFRPFTEDLDNRGNRQWLTEGNARWLSYRGGEQTLYPFLKLLPGGSIFVHSAVITRTLAPNNSDLPLRKTLTPHLYRNVVSDVTRTYPGQGACVLLPLSTNESKARVLVVVASGGAAETAAPSESLA